jgi:hypothetical protein
LELATIRDLKTRWVGAMRPEAARLPRVGTAREFMSGAATKSRAVLFARLRYDGTAPHFPASRVQKAKKGKKPSCEKYPIS